MDPGNELRDPECSHFGKMINSRQRKQRTQEPERDGTGRKGSVVGVQGAEEAGVAGVW